MTVPRGTSEVRDLAWRRGDETGHRGGRSKSRYSLMTEEDFLREEPMSGRVVRGQKTLGPTEET